MFIRCGYLGGERSDQGHHRARRVLRERAQAVQEAVREGRAPVGVQEATALREAQRPAQAEGPRRPQESQASRTDGRLAVTLLDVPPALPSRSEEHTSELQSPCNLVCRLLLEKKKKKTNTLHTG